MEFICNAAGDLTWFRLLHEGEAEAESEAMSHAVAKHFRGEWEKAEESYKPTTTVFIEQDIGKASHIRRAMPMFLTLRDQEGKALVTAMVPPKGKTGGPCIVVGQSNADPYPDHADAIDALGRHLGIRLDRASCYPYRR